MNQAITLTLRMPKDIRDYLQKRASRHNRSMNREILSILRDLEEKEMASGAKLGGSSPDADTTKCKRALSSASGCEHS